MIGSSTLFFLATITFFHSQAADIFCPHHFASLDVEIQNDNALASREGATKFNTNYLRAFYNILEEDGASRALRTLAHREHLSPEWADQTLSTLSDPDQTPVRCSTAAERARHGLFFIEIGSSDFGTRFEDFFFEPFAEGVAIEAVPELAEALPKRPGLFVENVAMGCGAGVTSIPFYHITREKVNALQLPRWALGTASFDEALAKSYEQQYPGFGWSNAVENITVPCLTWHDLVDKYGISATPIVHNEAKEQENTKLRRNLDLLKIDAEGADATILANALDWFASESAKSKIAPAWPTRIRWETAHKDNDATTDHLHQRLLDIGYVCTFSKDDQDLDCFYHNGNLRNTLKKKMSTFAPKYHHTPVSLGDGDKAMLAVSLPLRSEQTNRELRNFCTEFEISELECKGLLDHVYRDVETQNKAMARISTTSLNIPVVFGNGGTGTLELSLPLSTQQATIEIDRFCLGHGIDAVECVQLFASVFVQGNGH